MNRREFIDKLRKELSRLPQEEIDAAVEYYEEYFDDAGRENEKEVLEQLGSPKKVAAQIKSEYAIKLFDKEEKPAVKKKISAMWYVILGICSAPVSIPLAIVLVTVTVTILIALAVCVICLFAGIIGGILCAVACVILGIMAIPVSISTALMFAGAGICALGFMAAAGVLLFIGARAGTRAVVKAAKKQSERKKIRKMLDKSERKKWRYSEPESDAETADPAAVHVNAAGAEEVYASEYAEAADTEEIYAEAAENEEKEVEKDE